LYKWTPKGQAITFDHHEGVNVFKLGEKWWYIADLWRGQGVFRSDDCDNWEYQGTILDKPGKRTGDDSIGHHADVVVQGDEAYIFYFTHPFRNKDESKRSYTAVQVARLTTDGENLFCNRDEEYHFELKKPKF